MKFQESKNLYTGDGRLVPKLQSQGLMPISQQEKQFSSVKKVTHPTIASYPIAWVQDRLGMDGRRGRRGRDKV